MKILNPATGALLADMPEDGAFAVRKKYDRARAAQPGWAATPMRKRVAAMRELSATACLRNTRRLHAR